MESLKVPVFKVATGEILYVAPGVKAAWLKSRPNDYEDAEELQPEIDYTALEDPILDDQEKPKRKRRTKAQIEAEELLTKNEDTNG